MQGADSKSQRWALWAALAIIVVWGANFSVQKFAFTVLQPGGFLFARYLIMPVAAALLLCAHHGLHWPRLPRSEWLVLLKLGLAGHLVHVSLVTHGIHWSTPFSSSLILACGPVFTLLILRWYSSRRSAARRSSAWRWPWPACWCSCPTSCSMAAGAPAAVT